MLLPTLQSVARRLGQGELYEGIALDTDPLVMPKFASEIEVRAKQVGIFLVIVVSTVVCLLEYKFCCHFELCAYMVLCINQFAKTIKFRVLKIG